MNPNEKRFLSREPILNPSSSFERTNEMWNFQNRKFDITILTETLTTYKQFRRCERLKYKFHWNSFYIHFTSRQTFQDDQFQRSCHWKYHERAIIWGTAEEGVSRFKNASAAPEINNNPLMIISWGFAINHRRAHSFYRSTNSVRFDSQVGHFHRTRRSSWDRWPFEKLLISGPCPRSQWVTGYVQFRRWLILTSHQGY